MGSWNVTCFISGVSIGGCEQVYYIPLLKNEHYPSTLENSAYGFHRPTDFFTPATFPILGEYNTYGRLEDIVRDDNVLYLEKKYGKSIEEIVNPENKDFHSGVFVLKEVYDYMAINNTTMDKYAKDERIKYCGNYAYRAKKYLKELVDNYWFFKKIVSQDKEGTHKEQNEKYISDALSDIRDFRNSFKITFDLDGMVLLEIMPHIKKLYFNQIVNGRFYDRFLELNMLYVSLHSVGKLYFPTVNGPQGGDDATVNKLATITKKFLLKRKKERDE